MSQKAVNKKVGGGVESAALTFDGIRQRELAELVAERSKRLSGSVNAGPEKPAPPEVTVGLALSGGGIRSATFSLGVLQAIAARDHLQDIDYLSSVSGGGYVAAWLSAWVKRTSLADVERELKRSPESREREPNEVLWLRRYSNYLTPRVGALSLDALSVLSTWLRNVLLNMIILVFGVSAVLAIPIAVLPAVASLTHWPLVCAFTALAFMLLSLSFVAINLTLKCDNPPPSAAYVLSAGGVLWLVVLPALAASFFGGIWLMHPATNQVSWWQSALFGLMAFYVVVGTAWFIAWRVAAKCAKANAAVASQQVGPASPPPGASADVNPKDAVVYGLSAAVAAFVGVGLLIVLKSLFDRGSPSAISLTAPAAWDSSAQDAAAIFLFAPAGILLCLGIAASIFIGLVGRTYAEASREWFARTGGSFMMTSLTWIIWLGLAFYVPSMVSWVYDQRAWLTNTAFVTWLASLIGSIVLTRVRGQQKAEQTSGVTTILATLLTTIVACGVFVLISVGLHSVLDLLWLFFATQSPNESTGPYAYSLARYSASIWYGWPSVAVLFVGGATLIALLFIWRVDINRFSLHDMYKNRLIRCYLGASKTNRKPQPFVGFDISDDLPLTDLPARPHHIINTALNLVQGSELAWQERKAASFVFMRNYCGFQLSRAQGNTPVRKSIEPTPGMRPTAEYASKDADRSWRGITLGTAMAISGAAVSPNMGFQSQPALAALMTFFNLRLGRWCPNPAEGRWQMASPKFGLRYLLAELTGNTNESSDFVYLSDGGHFENTAVYELIRRRCTRILLVDVGADPTRAFDDLANMMRKCRIDLGVDFQLDASQLYADGTGFRSKSGFVAGRILYGDAESSPAFEGKILIVKPSLQTPPSETTDIYSYAKRALAFPQQTTVDQWFDESQFESYRKLGYSLADKALDSEPDFFGAS